MADRIPPQNLDAEKSVLGAILIDKNAIIEVAQFLRPEHFYSPVHGMVYEAILDLFAKGEPVDILTVSNTLKKQKKLEKVGGAVYLTELAEFVPTSSNSSYYGGIVKDAAIRRSLITVAGEINELGFVEDKEVISVLDEAEKKLFEIANDGKRTDFVHIKSLLKEAYEKAEELEQKQGQVRGIPTGFKSVDGILGGLQESNLVIIAARPSVGKSAFALDIARHACLKEGKAVGIFSLEMSNMELTDRLIASQVGINLWDYRMGKIHDISTLEKLGDVVGQLSEVDLYLDDTPGQTIMEIRTKARRLSLERKLDMIIIDYLQLIASGMRIDNRVQEVAEISKALKNLARELKIPVLALSQLSRAVEMRTTKTPQLSDLRESGCLVGDTKIFLPELGRYVSMKDLIGRKGFKVLALNETTYKVEPALVTNSFSTGMKQTYKLKTRLGRSIRSTANHKFLTIKGWSRLDSLTIGEHIALPRSIKSCGVRTMSDEQLALLGSLIGDGCTLDRHAIQYTTADISLANDIVHHSSVVFGDSINPRIKKERNWYQVYLSSSKKLTRGIQNPIAKWLRELKCFNLRSYEKFVPDEVFMQPEEGIATFLKYLWSTDGCLFMSQSTGAISVYYASSSYKLAYDVQSLLIRFGINATILTHPQLNKGRIQYHVAISGKHDLEIFINSIGIAGAQKIDAAKNILNALSKIVSNTNRDVIPKEVWSIYVTSRLKEIGMSQRKFQDKLEMSYCGSTLFKANLSRERGLKVGTAIEEQTLLNLAESDVYWDEVVSIEPDGVEEVFDFTVDKHHNFIADNIVVHNSIEQDADVVLMLSRPEKDDPEAVNKDVEVAQIIVAKHRNGPTGLVDLAFVRAQAKYADLDKYFRES